SDGRATWLTSGGPLPNPYLYQGTLQSYRNGQSVFGTYRPPEPAVDVGPVTLTFTDDSHGTITWPGGTVAIERQIFDYEDPIPAAVFALFDPPFRPQTGWWWNETESGTGFSVEVRGNSLFVVAFMYDDAGNPVWYFTAGPMASLTHYEGDWLLFSGGQTLTGPYRPPASPQMLGRAIIDFSSRDQGTIEFSELPTAKGKVAPKRSRLIVSRANLLGSHTLWPFSAHWPKWLGQVRFSSEERTSTTYMKESHQFLVTYDIQPPQAPGRATYQLNPNGKLTYHFEFTDSETGCQQQSDIGVGGALDGLLTVRDDLSYAGNVGLSSVVTSAVTEVCIDPSDGSTTTIRLPDRLVTGGVEFGGSQAYGTASRIVDFYPAFAYQPGTNRQPPKLKGTENSPPFYVLDWFLIAP
ncbi:MAG: hypothetical protein ABI812_02945, partial [Betaproteobacteria bacterium]